MNKLIISLPMFESVIEKAKQDFDVIYENQFIEIDRLISLSCEAETYALMVSMKHFFNKEKLEQLPKSVKIIATTSVGFDHIDINEAKKLGIHVTNTPDVLSDATADQAFLLMLASARRLTQSTKVIEKGWGKNPGFNENLGFDLNGKNLAIFGMGRIGQALAKKAKIFGMNILYCNRHRLPEKLENGAKFFESFDEMIPYADVLSLNAPATNETIEIMNTHRFNLMKKGSVFINVARGSLVNEDALVSALESGHLFGAGLDVYVNEPNIDVRFLKFDNVVLTPHIASATVETRTAMGLRALQNIIDSQTITPKDKVN